MKKFYSSLVALCLILAGGMMMVSCDEDMEDAIDLSGEWYGDMGMFIDLDGNPDTTDDIFDAYKTWIAFHQDDEFATYGWGEQVDFFDDGPYYRQNLYFNWRIRNQVLELTYPYNPGLDVRIRDYRFYDSRTTLRFTINNEYKCELYKLYDDQDNWYYINHYDHLDFNKYDYYYYYKRPNYSYTKSRDGKTESVEIKPENVKSGRDFSKFERINAVK